MTGPFRRLTVRTMTVRSLARLGGATPIDLGLVSVVAAVSVVGTAILTRGQGIDPLGYLLLVGSAAALVVHRNQPRAAMVAAVLFAFAYDAIGYTSAFYTIPIGIALYFVVDAGFRWLAVGVAAGVVAAFLTMGVVLGRGHVTDLTNALWFTGWLVASLVVGEVSRARRAYVEQVEQRAVEAERTREEEALRRASEERLRIARELHDILAHRISSINVQAGVGAHLLDRDPEQARRSLIAISEASREALRELRDTLGVLRQVDEPEPRAPSPGLAQLDGVIADTTHAGVRVDLEVAGEPRELPQSVDLAAYRIIEEALTNVVRHARAARAQVTISYRPSEVLIEIVDDGPGDAARQRSRSGGNGLLGMRERAATLGGELGAGPTPAGGFRVEARLPIAPAP
jgi:signal transduction histidine kinase